jgi:RimJ/RimL family protein N-acetyltransferase
MLRPAAFDDAERLLAWRNDPVTRANSRRQHMLNWDELSAVPSGVTRETYIAESDGTAVGTVSLDYADDECELSWTVAPEARGRGIGRDLVAAAIATARAPSLIAMIKPGNTSSRRIAQSLGFILAETRDGLEIWRRVKS